jgi:hypothetical protein
MDLEVNIVEAHEVKEFTVVENLQWCEIEEEEFLGF